MIRLYTTLFLLAGQIYLFIRLKKFIQRSGRFPVWTTKATAALFLFFNIPLLFLYFYIWRLSTVSPDIVLLLTPVFIWHIATLFIFLVLGIWELLSLPFRATVKIATLHPIIKSKVLVMKETERFKKFDASRRSFLQKGVIGLSAYSFVGATAGAVSTGNFVIKRVTVPIPRLPESFKGFTIGMMSDIHSSIFMNKDDMAEYIKAMNGLKTDLIVVTGDMVNSKTEEVYQFAEAFSELKARYGVFGCLGNHDFFTKNVDTVAKEIDACGVKMLRNDAVKIEKEGSFFNLVGVDDIGRNMKPEEYMTKALAFAKNDEAKILLCHKPYYFQNAKDLGVDLTLSGHTHGGQIVFGTVDNTPISLAALASKYVSGLYTLGESHLYVNDGIGYTGIPFRINCPAELTVITLV